jgi:hypothetical protein
MHRALYVLETIETTIRNAATPAGDNVYLGRLADFELPDLPAIDIVPGPDSPVNEYGGDNNVYIDSILRVWLDLHDYTIESERRLLEQLFELRSGVHAALMADQTLGVSWIGGVRYQGTEDLVVQVGETRTGSYRTAWDVWYRMPYSSPETP